jgi:bifunctional enzyme CysN/CysC
MKKEDNNLNYTTIVVAGSVDDGKSTLIGRLLFDSGQVYEDQIEAVKMAGGGNGEIDFSLFTDGLSSEREQKITIDVAYRYFFTRKGHFVIADVPGHEQYTRNMFTGASKADKAVILVDVRKGLLEQTKRHLFILALLRVPSIAIVINKMDLVGYDEKAFIKVKKQCISFCKKIKLNNFIFVPVSSINGDTVVRKKCNMPWYKGKTVLNFFEKIKISYEGDAKNLRLPIQLVVRNSQCFRGYAGMIESGKISIGDEVIVLPSREKTVIEKIFVSGDATPLAVRKQSVLVSLKDDIDIGRGDLIYKNKKPFISNDFLAFVCWFGREKMNNKSRYFLKHTTHTTSFLVQNIEYVINKNDFLTSRDKKFMSSNDIGLIRIRTQEPIYFDYFSVNQSMGSFIIIDELTNNTVGGGIITKNCSKKEPMLKEDHGAILWFTGLSCAGKTTISSCLFKKLKSKGIKVESLDGDVFRRELSLGLNYSENDRIKNIKVASYVANKLSNHGVVVLASFISPYRKQRNEMKKNKNFFEIYVKASIDTCKMRDVKGLYKKAQSGEINNFTGISHPYEEPLNPDLILDTDQLSVEQSVKQITNFLIFKKII